jgi:hypothetical protein
MEINFQGKQPSSPFVAHNNPDEGKELGFIWRLVGITDDSDTKPNAAVSPPPQICHVPQHHVRGHPSDLYEKLNQPKPQAPVSVTLISLPL